MTTTWALIFCLGLVGAAYAYLLAAIALSRRDPQPPDGSAERFHVIFLVPCLNEHTVVEDTVLRLTTTAEHHRVVVIDDASDDATPNVLEPLQGHQVLVVRRELPDARKGKGAALNHAYRMIREAADERDVPLENIIVGVLDADGQIDRDALDTILPWFLDPEVGGVQVAVRMINRTESLLSRMQDIEFAGFIRMLQRGRNHLTSTGLGGNGQFTRLAALDDVGAEPWTNALTEDLDLGIRLRVNGWLTIFDERVSVHQQGLHSPRLLLRQRTRWFQGHLQAWSLLPQIRRARLPIWAKLDLTCQLFLPVMLLLLSVAIAASFVRAARTIVADPENLFGFLTDAPGLPWWYIIGFIATPLVAAAYWSVEKTPGIWRIIAYAHLYAIYTWVWFFAGWQAVWRQFRGSHTWVKTPRYPATVTSQPAVVDLTVEVVSAIGSDNVPVTQ